VIAARRYGETLKLDKFFKQLRRDATANPKKAALLGLMVLVALYFWAPLAVKFAARNTADQEKAVELNNGNLVNNSPAASRSLGKFQWEKVRDLMRKDEHMVSATFNPAWVDPFGGKRSTSESELSQNELQSEVVEDIAAKRAAMLKALEPKDLGITLGGIMIGPRGRSAAINGETCREGDVLSIGLKNDKTVSLDLQVLKITRRSVQLETNGKIFTVEFATPTLGAGDDFRTANTK
jgi:hypothetical protein